jgi:protein-S-isoprenylcysteine O-methyltransferase Ste14
MSATDILAFITILVWPAVPLFWIPVHGFPRFFRKIEFMSYLVPLILWLPLVWFFFAHRDFLLRFRLQVPVIIRIAGLVLLLAGTALHVWTGKLLGIKGLIGLPEISSKMHGRLTNEGPFSVVRHPTYLAHTVMFAGVFLVTGVVAVSVVTLLDFIIINTVVIPLEERELEARFGDEYRRYKKSVPQFFPRISRKKR